MGAAHSSLSPGEDELSEPDKSGGGGGPGRVVQGLEQPKGVGYLEAFSDEGPHVAIHRLHVVARSEAQCIQLVGRFPLRLATFRPDAQRVEAGNDLHHFHSLAGPHALHPGVLQAPPQVVAVGVHEELLHLAPHALAGVGIEVEDQRYVEVLVPPQQRNHRGIIHQVPPLPGVPPEGLVGNQQLGVVLRALLPRSVLVVLVDPGYRTQRHLVLQGADDGLGHGLGAESGPHPHFKHALGGEGVPDEGVVQGAGVDLQGRRKIRPFLRELTNQEPKIRIHAIPSRRQQPLLRHHVGLPPRPLVPRRPGLHPALQEGHRRDHHLVVHRDDHGQGGDAPRVEATAGQGVRGGVEPAGLVAFQLHLLQGLHQESQTLAG
mmetsp:Transcript_95280/g.254810  ORF Transcript_95280/g.254810 Transcript_95280/m.254810 type:complete len:375 (-) Transcript_95280:20-1144(-)